MHCVVFIHFTLGVMVDGKKMFYISCSVNMKSIFSVSVDYRHAKLPSICENYFFVTLQTPNPFAKEVNL